MSPTALQLKMDLLQKVMDIQNEATVRKLLKVIESDQHVHASPAMVAFMQDEVRLSTEEVEAGKVLSNSEVKEWIEKKKASRNGN